MTDYKALIVEKHHPRVFKTQIKSLSFANLPNSEVLIKVFYSSLNYKDILSCEGNPAVTRRFPHTPGLDASGVVEESKSNLFKRGDRVAVFCTPMGMNHAGGLSEYISVPAEWLISLPEDMGLEEVMIYGTAGYTAALAVSAIEKHGIDKSVSKVLVTGASGGLGSIAVLLLQHLGYDIEVNVTREGSKSFLKRLGVSAVTNLNGSNVKTFHNLLPSRWQAVIDVAGGDVLSYILKQVSDNGILVSTGLVAGTRFETNVLPFILRGISLKGINAEGTDKEVRKDIMIKLSSVWRPPSLDKVYKKVKLKEIVHAIEGFKEGDVYGRVVVDMEAS
ncbi:oxidoreductase [Candidatus Saccharibacteria bacterium]|nr:oxidoreductase [Candidatus Saccharibacteria bacterium]MEC8965649.1 YhdH/YhfP family quinone oxidoreductase [Pseudomonadota bacterium]HCV01473.1 oxidoreductase [Pseudoalteromonas sp.]|tara:strand:- start:15491 stop:16489 length:999 start_codon:yes stop_codon:yes gene_type:complete